VKIEEMIDWVVEEVKNVPDTILNDNFTVLAIEGILSMLNGEGCQELGLLCELTASSDTVILQVVLEDVQKLAGRIMQKWWKLHGLPKGLGLPTPQP
jgi:hypothetical protein